MKIAINQFALASVLMAKAADVAEATPGEASAAAPAVETDKVEDGKAEASPITLSFVGIDFTPESLTKLESQWKSAQGRIKSAVSERMDYILSLDPEAEDRKKSKLKAGRNVVDDIQLTTNPKAVLAVAKEMLANRLISEGDARVWSAYVTLAEALRLCRNLGRI